MDTQKIIFKDEESAEQIAALHSTQEIQDFLETFKLEVKEVIELGDAMYTVKNISKNEEDTSQITVEVEYMDLIENKPTA